MKLSFFCPVSLLIKGDIMTNNIQLLKEIGSRLEEIRVSLGLSVKELTSFLGIGSSSYTKYKYGVSLPRLHNLISLSDRFDISLDWLIRGKGPMLYKVKTKPEEKNRLEPVMEDVKELLDHMERIPLLRYQVLSFFQEFKLKHKELLEQTAAESDANS